MSKYTLLITLFLSLIACAGDKPYDEHADAKSVIEQAASVAKQQNKPMVIVFGANWCPDCRALSNAIEHGSDAAKIAQKFKLVKVNVGNFDKNITIANAYGNPISGGIPGAAILTPNQQLIYVTQPGELSNALRTGDAGIYTLLAQHVKPQTDAPK
jgi:protein disulfide-isomerase